MSAVPRRVVEQLRQERPRADQPHQHVRERHARPRRRRTSSPALRAGTASRMALRRAPSALRSPISRVRSVTDTNMMFITPTPPMASVSTPMNVSTSFRPSTMPAGDLLQLGRAEDPQRALVGRIEAQALAEHLLHLVGRPRVERRIHRLIDERVEVLGVPQLSGRRVRDEHALLVGPAVVRELHLLLLHADHVERHAVDAHASRRPAASCRTASAPPRCRGTPTRRCSRTSSASMKRPDGRRLRAHVPVGGRHAAGQVRRLLRPPRHGDVAARTRGSRPSRTAARPTASASASRSRMRLPARSPPACMLVWPGEHDRHAVAERAAGTRAGAPG